MTARLTDGLEKYLGAWGHMLAVSDHLIDMTHTHPLLADGSAEMQRFVLTVSKISEILKERYGWHAAHAPEMQ